MVMMEFTDTTLLRKTVVKKQRRIITEVNGTKT